jgi:hypothetical protein
MDHNRQSADAISYAQSADSKRGQSVIMLLENVTGRLALIKRAHGYQDEIAQGRNFWQVIVERYGLSSDIRGGSINCILKTGPLILVANHPYGILDGVMLSYILLVVRGDFWVLAHEVFQKSEALETAILMIKFDATKDAVRKKSANPQKSVTISSRGRGDSRFSRWHSVDCSHPVCPADRSQLVVFHGLHDSEI